MPTFVGMTDGVNRRVCINAGWYEKACMPTSVGMTGRRLAVGLNADWY
jgi:hypothetical protein